MTTIRDGALLIAQERQRQIDVEGYTPEHDALHDPGNPVIGGDLANAAFCYVTEVLPGHVCQAHNHDHVYERCPAPVEWPGPDSDWKPSPDPVRNLVKAGALIAAEIDRLLNAAGLVEPPSAPTLISGADGPSAGALRPLSEDDAIEAVSDVLREHMHPGRVWFATAKVLDALRWQTS